MIRTFNISTIVLGLLCVFFTTNKVVAQIPCVPGSSYSLCQYLGISSVDSTRDFQVQQTDFLHPSGVGARVGILGQLGPDTIFFAVKKTSGPIDWVKTYTGIGNIKAHRFISTSTTVYIVSYDNTNDWQLGDVHIMAVDINNGNINWSKTVGTVAQDYYPQIFRYYDNNVTAYRLAVLFRSKLTQHTENLTYVQLDQSGTVLYSQQYDVEGNEITRDVSMYYDGSLPFAAGVSFGFVGKRLDTDKGFLATLTADGTAQNAIQIEYGGAFFEARELQPHYNFQPPCYSVFSGFVISGEVPYNLPNTYWRSLIKLDPSKKVAWYRDYDNLDIDFSLIDSTRNYFYQKSSTGTPYSEYFALVEPNVTSSFGSGIFFVDTSGNSISNAPIGSLNAFAFNSGNVQQFLAANFVHNDFGIVHGVSDTILTFSGFSESGCSDNGFVPLIPNNKNAYDTTNIGLMQLAITINESTPSFVEDNFSPIENYKPIIVCDQNGPECSLTADFTFDGSCVADSISFTNTSVDPGGNNIIYAYWDFGDGNHSELMNPKHKYNAVGTYDVMLYVINDSCGPCIDTVTYSVEIDDGCCIDTCTTCLIPVEGETYTLTVDVKDIYFLPNNVQGDTDTAFVTVRFPQTDSIAGPFYSANYGIGYNTISGQFVYPVGLETNALELRFHFRSRGVRFGDARLVPLSGSPVYIYDHNIHRFIEE